MGRATDGRPKPQRTIIDRPLPVIASLTTPTDRPATSTIPGVAVAYPRRINAPSNPMVKPFGAAVRVAGQRFQRADLVAGQSRVPRHITTPYLSSMPTMWPFDGGRTAARRGRSLLQSSRPDQRGSGP
jgi:hypothetical protein